MILEFNYTFKWVDDQKYGKRNKETGEWNGMMGELLAQVSILLPPLQKNIRFDFDYELKIGDVRYDII